MKNPAPTLVERLQPRIVATQLHSCLTALLQGFGFARADPSTLSQRCLP